MTITPSVGEWRSLGGFRSMTSNTPGPTGDEYAKVRRRSRQARKHIDAATAGNRRTSLFAALKGGWLKTAAELATILSLVVAIIAVVPNWGSDSTPATAPSEVPTVTSPEILFDNFNDPNIDTKKWEVLTSKEVPPYVANGKLHFKVTQSDGQGNLSANLRAMLQGPITDVRFELTLVNSERESTGGEYTKVFSEGGRQHKLVLRPTGSDSPNLDYYICDKAACDNHTYNDFRHEYRRPIRARQPYQVHIHQDNHGWMFEVEGFPPVTAPGEDGPIARLEFALFSHGNPFHITVDNVRVTYA